MKFREMVDRAVAILGDAPPEMIGHDEDGNSAVCVACLAKYLADRWGEQPIPKGEGAWLRLALKALGRIDRPNVSHEFFEPHSADIRAPMSARQGMQFPWRLIRSTISADLELIWQMSVKES